MNPQAYLNMVSTENNHWWFVGRRKILESLINKIKLPENSKVLEIGCGTGGNFQLLNKFGILYAVELDSIALEIAKSKINNLDNLKLGSCPDKLPALNAPFDLICLFDVLEHIEEDEETLRVLEGLLTQQGRIVLTVPAYQWLFGPHDIFLHHKRRYTIGKIKKILRNSNLKIERVTYFNTILFPIAALVRLKEKLTNLKNISGVEIPNKWINKILKALFSAESKYLAKYNFIYGVSIYCEIKKNNVKNII